MPNYLVWYRHGESIRHVDAEVELDDDHDRMDDMLHDLGREVEMNVRSRGSFHAMLRNSSGYSPQEKRDCTSTLRGQSSGLSQE